jgi:antibiotic biosynthesis monooxygenase (ABM) superfamily enzyme
LAWEKSPESIKLLEEVSKFSTRYYEAATGMETWFNLPDLKTVVAPPPKWKMIIVIFIAAYCISSLSRSILNPFLAPWPILASNIIYSTILVISFTYLAMPFLNRLLRRWLYPSTVEQQQKHHHP